MPSAKTAFRELFVSLGDPSKLPALFHCSAGKDRAGWAGTVVLLTLGVDEDQVVEQYLLSNRAIEQIRERLANDTGDAPPKWGNIMRPFLEVRRDYIQASFTAMHEEWGSFDRYLHEGLGITETQRDHLRELMLD